MVRLRDQEEGKHLQEVDDFNSSMVRLRVVTSSRLASKVSLFQFQYGAIESDDYEVFFFSRMIFQFQYGAIESCSDNPDTY